ncbi:MAG: PD-(D/E)XK nuclease family protein, partial [Deltaproteobacteria bacterium]|nr:PD-(D/E)XK nuclease family protein [Deltaproteobacteria bacterium]
MERVRPDGGTDLLLGPIAAALDREDPIADHLRAIDKQKADHEAGRLLYVACTRAQEELHLFGHLRARAKDGGRFPAQSSLLGHLWPAVVDAYEVAPLLGDDPQADAGETAVPDPGQTLWRLDATWSPEPLPKVPERILSMVAPPPSTDSDESGAEERSVTFDWATPLAAAVGTVVHRHLERFAHTGLGAWSRSRVAALEPAIRASLRMLALSGEILDEGVSRVQKALLEVLDDSRAAWIFDSSHEDSQAELALRARLDGEVVTAIVDRTFIDAGVRWIIDYKTGTHEGGSLAHFLDAEQVRYRGQLERYGRIFALRGDEPIRLALYFPLLAAWRAWPYALTSKRTKTSDESSP